jgi:hypothetical protein
MFENFFKNLNFDFDYQEKINFLLIENLENKGKISRYILKHQKTMNKQHKLELIRRLKIANRRHNETPYDEILKAGHSRATARHFII